MGKDIIQEQLSAEKANERFRQLLKSNHEFYRIDRFDTNNRSISSTSDSPLIFTAPTIAPLGNHTSICLTPQPDSSLKNSYLLSCQIPLIKENAYVGSIVISYRLQNILEEMAPWWFAQDNQISLLNSDEKILANRSAGGPGKNFYTHNRVLELPGLSLILRTNSNKSEPKLL